MSDPMEIAASVEQERQQHEYEAAMADRDPVGVEADALMDGDAVFASCCAEMKRRYPKFAAGMFPLMQVKHARVFAGVIAAALRTAQARGVEGMRATATKLRAKQPDIDSGDDLTNEWVKGYRAACDDVAKALPASDAPASPWPKVKALVWRRYNAGLCFETDTVLGWYRVWKHPREDGVWMFGMHLSETRHASEDAAKAAAQADYERRILSALDLPTPPLRTTDMSTLVERLGDTMIAHVKQVLRDYGIPEDTIANDPEIASSTREVVEALSARLTQPTAAAVENPPPPNDALKSLMREGPATPPTGTEAGTLPERLNRLIPLHGYGEPHRPRETLIEAIQRIADLERRLAEANSALATANSTVAGLANKVGEARRERDAALASLAEMKAMIADSVAVHVNMLRGAIAKPSVENIRHLYPEIAASLAEKERRIGELEEALRPFANTVFNDNGDVSYDYTLFDIDDLFRAYSVLKRAALTPDAGEDR